MRNEEEFLKALLKEKLQILGIDFGMDIIEAIAIFMAAKKIANLIPGPAGKIAKIGVLVGGGLAMIPLNKMIVNAIEKPIAKKANVPTTQEILDAVVKDDPEKTAEQIGEVLMKYMDDENKNND